MAVGYANYLKINYKNMSKEVFLSIQEKLWDISPTYPNELSKSEWLSLCSKFYNNNSELFKN